MQLQSLVQYQDGSIVSHELISKPAGTVTLFSFDKGQGLSEHAAPFDVLVIVLEGEARITIDETSHVLLREDSIVIPSGHPHAVKAEKQFKMLLIMIRS